MERVKALGFKTRLKVPASEEMLRSWPEVRSLIEAGGYDSVEVQVPDYTPVERMRNFEISRPRLRTAERRIGWGVKPRWFSRGSVSGLLPEDGCLPAVDSLVSMSYTRCTFPMAITRKE